MLDEQYRISIGLELLKKAYREPCTTVWVYYEQEQKRLILKWNPYGSNYQYFVKTQNIDKKGRMVIPAPIRNAFPEATYLPVECGGEIYILIIGHEKKPE